MEVPKQVKVDPRAEDLLRVWRTSAGQVSRVRLEHWSDPAAWGILLADLARHVARSYAEAGLREENAALQRVVSAFRAQIPVAPELVRQSS